MASTMSMNLQCPSTQLTTKMLKGSHVPAMSKRPLAIRSTGTCASKRSKAKAHVQARGPRAHGQARSPRQHGNARDPMTCAMDEEHLKIVSKMSMGLMSKDS